MNVIKAIEEVGDFCIGGGDLSREFTADQLKLVRDNWEIFQKTLLESFDQAITEAEEREAEEAAEDSEDNENL